MSKTIIIDPGHGGFDAGATFENRKEKEDSLQLALAVGRALENAGYTIYYTRTDDRYDSPYDKAQFANNTGGDLFLSFHRNAAQNTDQYQGVQALVYDKNPLALRVGKYVNENLENIGFRNVGIESRKELVVLRRTEMPAVLLEVGFINSNYDNQLFDERFPEIVSAIADGVERALPLNATSAEHVSEDETMAAANFTLHTDTAFSEEEDNSFLFSAEDEKEEPSQEAEAEYIPLAERLHAAMHSSMPQEGQNDRLSIQPAEPNREDDNRSMDRTMDRTDREPMSDWDNDRREDRPTMRPTTPMNPANPANSVEDPLWYYVQVGLFRYPENAVYLMEQLKQQGYDAVWNRVGGLIAIWVGPKETLDDAVTLQRSLMDDGYETLIVTDHYIQR